jgi:hypothetical protein
VAGCTLIYPLDQYVGHGAAAGHGGGNVEAGSGGDVGQAGTTGGLGGSTQGGSGGAAAKGGSAGAKMGGSGGGGGDGGSPDGGNDDGGAGAGGDDHAGENPGGTGQGGSGGTSGAGTSGGGSGGMSGAGTGGRGGRGGEGGVAAMSGSAGSGGCAGADLGTSSDNCGMCGSVCASPGECLMGTCVTKPCQGICAGATEVHLSPGQDYKESNITDMEVCRAVFGYAPVHPKSFVCWQMQSRVTQLNSVSQNCDGVGHQFTLAERAGGYCVHVTAQSGNNVAGFEFPD